jgi:hypothetical protein
MKNQPDLSELLQTWKLQPASDSGFNRRVWSRIEVEEISRPSLNEALFGWLQVFALPKFAMAAVAIAIFSGVFIGGIQARTSQEENYMASLNPFNSISHRS